MTETDPRPRSTITPPDMRHLTHLRRVSAEELVPVPFASAGQLRASETGAAGEEEGGKKSG